MKKRLRTYLAALCAALVAAAAIALLLDHCFPPPLDALRPQSATVVLDREGRPLRFFLPPDKSKRLRVALQDVSPELKKALIASEDRWFYRHPGVNPLAVLRACWSNLASGRTISGASTIPMQIARMAEPGPRTLRSKIAEAFRALQLSARFSKNELLETYLNMLPYGGNIVGVGAASYYYFGKSPNALSLGEAALLTAIPRSPARYDPVRQPTEAKTARDRVLHQLARRGPFSIEEITKALKQPLPTATLPTPMHAPHFSRMAKNRGRPGSHTKTSLDRRTQSIAEARVGNRIQTLRAQGIGNAACVVVDTASREVLALVGSADFFDPDHQGQINMANVKRSPGSTLKPFLYALAMDQGRIIPESYLLDVPTDFSGYTPRNYDQTFQGRVTVRQALTKSLNVPAVRLLARTGLDEFHSLLKKGGLNLDKPARYYGLPLVLGACESTLLELTALYATLAAGGESSPLSFKPRPQGEKIQGESIISAEADWLTSVMLAQVPRPDMSGTWMLTRDAPSVAWKTGTSFGHRDAWAIGFSGRLTIGVWVGNPDGKPRKGISGATHAGPLLFDLFRALERGGAPLQKPDNLDLMTIDLCAEDHLRPGPLSDKLIKATAIRGRTRLPVSTLHKKIFVDAETGLRLMGDCLKNRPAKSVVVTEYPPELSGWLESMGSGENQMPPLSPECKAVPSGPGPKIVSPCARTPYRIRKGVPDEFQRIALKAHSAQGGGNLFWYQDGALVANGPVGEQLFLKPEPGRHRLVVVDELGRMDVVSFVVEGEKDQSRI